VDGSEVVDDDVEYFSCSVICGGGEHIFSKNRCQLELL
jgi:hypothetical protein